MDENEEQDLIPNPERWMEEYEINIDILSQNDWTGEEDDFPSAVPVKWVVDFHVIDKNQIILTDSTHFIDMSGTEENHIYKVGGKPYIKIDNFAYPIVMLDANKKVLDFNNFSSVEELQNQVDMIIVLMAETQGYLNYFGQLIREKR